MTKSVEALRKIKRAIDEQQHELKRSLEWSEAELADANFRRDVDMLDAYLQNASGRATLALRSLLSIERRQRGERRDCAALSLGGQQVPETRRLAVYFDSQRT